MVENLCTRALMTLLAIACLAFGLFGLIARPAAAGSPSSPDAAGSASLRLEVDTSVLDAELGARLAEQLEAAVAGLTLVGLPPAEGQPRLRIRVIGFDEDQRDYELELELSGAGRSTVAQRVHCEACNERRMVDLVLDEAVALVQRAWLGPDSEPVLGPTQAPVVADESSPDRPPRPRLTKTGVSGAVLLGAGVTTLTAGVAVWLGGVEQRVDPTSARVELRDLRPTGAVTMGAGALITTIGAALLAQDLRQQSTRKRRGVSLRLTPTFVGVQFRQRF